MIVSPGTPYPACSSFANRLREAIEVANISVHGKRLNLTVSIGVVNVPVDRGVASAEALLDLACARLRAAQEAGGNRVCACDAKSSNETLAPKLAHAIELIKAGHERAVVPHLLALGRQVLPLLHLLERELKLGLPLAAIETKVLDQVSDSKDTRQE
ncbi:MAG: hypothetical protein HY777_04480 [Betaproteobacteria bacterium]|nr:hypothetical protein [Betaproteobacteria bacterium]